MFLFIAFILLTQFTVLGEESKKRELKIYNKGLQEVNRLKEILKKEQKEKRELQDKD